MNSFFPLNRMTLENYGVGVVESTVMHTTFEIPVTLDACALEAPKCYKFCLRRMRNDNVHNTLDFPTPV